MWWTVFKTSNGMDIKIEDKKGIELRKLLEQKNDSDSERLKRFLAMPDLSRTKGSPLNEIVDQALNTESLKGFDVIEIPEIVPTNILFDLFTRRIVLLF